MSLVPTGYPKGSSSLRNGVGRKGCKIEAQTLSEDALGGGGQSAFPPRRKTTVQSPAAHICNPNSWEMEAGESLAVQRVLGQSGLHETLS